MQLTPVSLTPQEVEQLEKQITTAQLNFTQMFVRKHKDRSDEELGVAIPNTPWLRSEWDKHLERITKLESFYADNKDKLNKLVGLKETETHQFMNRLMNVFEKNAVQSSATPRKNF